MELWVPASRFRRVGEDRIEPADLERWWADEGAGLVRVTPDGNLASDEAGTELRVGRPGGVFEPNRHFLLGFVDDRPWFTTVVEPDGPAASLRQLGDHLSDTERDLATTAVALVNWNRVVPQCAVCGGPTAALRGGHVRYCAVCDRERFPRTDPAVIVAVVDADDRLLLGHQRAWANNRVSLLAGFVEAGESLEQAVRREVLEEAGVTLEGLVYVASQPWPFPRSLMLAFVARALDADVTVDGDEIEWARFYTRDEVRALVGTGEITLPTQSSVAARIVDLWLAAGLPTP